MESLLRLLPQKPPPIWVRYGASALLVLAAFLVHIGLRERAGPYGFILYIPPIVFASIAFDRGSGFLALALSIIAVASTLPWREVLFVHGAPMVVFGVIGAALVLVSEGMRKALERAVRAEREKDLLLRELSHRVKNNFAAAASMLGLQERTQQDAASKEALRSAVSRLNVMARAHDHLLQTEAGTVNMKEYLEELGRHLGDTLRGARPIAVRVSSEPIQQPAERAIGLGIVANELATNCFKYAYPDDAGGTVTIELRRTGPGEITLTVGDAGRGCPDDGSEGLGTRLVRLFTEQLGGQFERRPGNPGCISAVRIPHDAET